MFAPYRRGLSRSQRNQSLSVLNRLVNAQKSQSQRVLINRKPSVDIKAKKEYPLLTTPVKRKKMVIMTEEKTKRKESLSLREGLFNRPVLTSDFAHIKINRGRMIDWMFEICFHCRQNWSTFWSAVSVMDFLIIQHHFVRVDNIHLVGTVCLFMSSKIHETSHIRLKQVIENILHGCFSKQDVINMEMEILNRMCSGEKSVPVHTMFQLFTQYFSGATKEQVNEGLKQLAYIWMDISKVVPLGKTFSDLFKDVSACVINGQPYPGTEETASFFKKYYDCDNISKYYQNLEW